MFKNKTGISYKKTIHSVCCSIGLTLLMITITMSPVEANTQTSTVGITFTEPTDKAELAKLEQA